MADPLEIIWNTFDAPECVFTPGCVGGWPPGSLDVLLNARLLREGTAADRVICPACDDYHVEEVIPCEEPDGRTRFFVYCPEALRVEVPPESLRRWSIGLNAVARAVADAMLLSGRCTVVIPSRLWRLGREKRQGASRDVLLARGLLWPDGGQIAHRIDTLGRAIVFVADQVPPDHLWPELPPPVIALSDVARFDAGRIELDLAAIATVVNEADARNRAVRPVALTPKQQKQAFRQAAGDVLKSAINDNEYVQAYLEHGSYRKAAEALSKRYRMPITKDAVSRAVRRRGGPNAVRCSEDSHSVRRTVASQRRDRKRNFFRAPETTKP